MTLVLINDHVANKRVKLFYTDEDFAITDGEWNNSDQLLADLQHHQFFAGKLLWSDLDPFHFRLMITKSLQACSKMTDAERMDDEDPSIRSLNFLVCGLIRCIEGKSDSHIEVMRIHRVGDIDVSFEYEAIQTLEPPSTIKMPPRKKDGFSVVVDNTKT